MNLKEAVIMPGMVNNVEYYYAISDAYVQSSHREALPLSVLEAMAAGLPIISTKVSWYTIFASDGIKCKYMVYKNRYCGDN